MNRRPGRKLLVASIGIAAVNYVACGNTITGNLASPPDAAKDGGLQDAILANLAQPPPDAGLDAPSDVKGDGG